MSFCPDLLEVITIGGRTGTVVELIGKPCHAFIVEFGDGDLQTFDQFGVPVPPLLESRPGKMGGQVCIAGTRIPAACVKRLREDGLEPAKILRLYPDLTLEQIQAALDWDGRS